MDTVLGCKYGQSFVVEDDGSNAHFAELDFRGGKSTLDELVFFPSIQTLSM